ncbi:tetratricopeptide repeat protein [Planctomycetota bacterium]
MRVQSRTWHLNLGLFIILGMLASEKLRAQTSSIEQAQEQFRTGQYTQCLEIARNSLEERRYNQGWRILYFKSLLAVGEYKEAINAINQTLRRYQTNIQYLRLAYTIYRANGQVDKARGILEQMVRYGQSWGREYWSSADMVTLGEALLWLGAEPRAVLEGFFSDAIANDPDCREAYIAAGNLALDKNDYALAGDFFQKALKRFNDEPDMHYGLARAFYHSDRKVMIKSLDAALHINPIHAPSLLLKAEHQIDAEDLRGAQETLERIHAVNSRQVEAWAFRSLLAYLDNDPNTARDCREKALEFWSTNPKVDYLIGKKLSQNYRFAEGAAYQQLSLKFDVDYQPAQMQLAQDLLRLGYEEQGWQLAREVYDKDAYNVEAYNLVNLNDHMAKFKTLESDEFMVRMSETEADVFGDMVLELLAAAKAKLCDKYGLELERPIVTEMFDNQQDFAVRTFGMPGGDGFLGVCFGPVITMNSPKAERPANWQATLWHEFCHVVTLNLTQNKMPRWLSEGISVYEESQKDPTWGQYMNPEFRRMILEGEMAPLGKLSGAFINPATGNHLLFAYYESSLAVE